jgi:hypothetical protein
MRVCLVLVALLAMGCSGNGAHVSGTQTSTTTIVPADALRGCGSTMASVPAAQVPSDIARLTRHLPVAGSGALWTIARPLGGSDRQVGEWFIKMPWFTRPLGIPAITGRRLDGTGTFHATADEATAEYGTWIASNLFFSSAGCWEVTGRYRGSTLEFRVRIGPPSS